MKHLFVGGPWDGQVHDLAAEFGVTDAQRGAIQVPTSKPDDPVMSTMLYYPRKYRWAADSEGGMVMVEIEVMTDSMSKSLGGALLLHLFRLAGLDVTWQHDPNDPG